MAIFMGARPEKGGKSPEEKMEDEKLIEKYVAYKTDILALKNTEERWKFLYCVVRDNKEDDFLSEAFNNLGEEERLGEIEKMEKEFADLLKKKGILAWAEKTLSGILKNLK